MTKRHPHTLKEPATVTAKANIWPSLAGKVRLMITP